MKGKLFVIEGSDASGKATQSELLYQILLNMGLKVQKVSFPDYESDSSALVKMYLKGDFGHSSSDVNAYVASTFYAIDRYASYKTKWGNFYNEGGIVVADRYTTSNLIHQAVKIIDEDEKNTFLNWLMDFEYNLFSLPKPDCVVFLNMPYEKSMQLMENRANKATGEIQKDIHEKDATYLLNAYQNALYVAEKFHWKKVNCLNEQRNIRTIENISAEILNIIKQYL